MRILPALPKQTVFNSKSGLSGKNAGLSSGISIEDLASGCLANHSFKGVLSSISAASQISRAKSSTLRRRLSLLARCSILLISTILISRKCRADDIRDFPEEAGEESGFDKIEVVFARDIILIPQVPIQPPLGDSSVQKGFIPEASIPKNEFVDVPSEKELSP